jgi:HupE / UreJ protein
MKTNNTHLLKIGSLLLIGICFSAPAMAHASVIEIEKMGKMDAAWLYVTLGYAHILPLGLDHILFVISLVLLNPKLKSIFWQATAFTIAHTVTLGLTMFQIIKPLPSIVEPIIALSIVYVALENIFSPKLRSSRIAIVFLFGLIHGMGFASALGELGLPQNAYLTSLLMFNVGVELGQITVILAVYFLVVKWFGNKVYYQKRLVLPMSLLIAAVAAFWTVERLL